MNLNNIKGPILNKLLEKLAEVETIEEAIGFVDPDKEYFFTYMLLCENGTFYTGYSPNPIERLRKHQEGKGAKYTKAYRPLDIVFLKRFETKSEALKCEAFVRKLSHKEKEVIAIAFNKSRTQLLNEKVFGKEESIEEQIEKYRESLNPSEKSE